MTKTERLAASFERGTTLTANQIYGSFNLLNPTAAISNLREQGYNIKSKRITNSRGKVVTKYRLAS